MGGLAQLAQAAGHVVSGCDANVYPPMSDQLAAANVRVIEGYGADQLSLAPDVWVIGNVITRGNPLMEAILDSGSPATYPGHSGWPTTCCAIGTCWRWPARMARRQRVRCLQRFSITRVSILAF